MNEPVRILTVLQPPPGGLERLRARRDSASRWSPWWVLASGCAAAVAWLAVASGQTDIQMQLSGGRLVGERSQGEEVQILENGHAVPVPTADPGVHMYWVEHAVPKPAEVK
jgi:hypothetical protein